MAGDDWPVPTSYEPYWRRDGDARYPTGLEKFGAVVGDDSKFGCNAVSHPGTVLGKGCFVMPCATVRGCVAPGTLIGG